MNNSKQTRRLKNLWYKRDFKKWIEFKEKLGRYPKGTKSTSEIFLLDSTIWNTRYTHEEEQLKHYADWNPYCCNMESSCNSRAWDRMVKIDNGWKCEFCGMVIGKHLFRIIANPDFTIASGFDNYRGTPNIKPIAPKKEVQAIAIGETDINVLKDFMETNQRVFPKDNAC